VDRPILIRQAQPADGAALMSVVAQIDAETEFLGVPGHPHPWAKRPEIELRSLADNGRGVVLLALTPDNTIIGYISAFTGHFTRNRGNLFIAIVGMREAYRGQGIGTRLFEEVEKWAREHRIWRLELRVSSLNERGQALYRKRGFIIEGRIRGGAAPPRQDTASPLLRPMAAGDGLAFQAWDARMAEVLPFSLKLAREVAPAEAIERDLAGVPPDPRLWMVATVPAPSGGEDIVGFASGNIEIGFRMQHDAFVNVAVLPEWQGQGLGRKLHDRIESWALDQGVRRLTATIQAPNLAGRAFATALGYETEVTMRAYSLIGGRMLDRLRLGKLFGA